MPLESEQFIEEFATINPGALENAEKSCNAIIAPPGFTAYTARKYVPTVRLRPVNTV